MLFRLKLYLQAFCKTFTKPYYINTLLPFRRKSDTCAPATFSQHLHADLYDGWHV